MNKHKTQSSCTNGFTLIEVVIAILLFGLTAAGVASSLSYGLSLIYSARDLTLAQSILENEITNLRGLPATALQPVEKGPFSHSDSMERLGGKGELTLRPLAGTDLMEVTATLFFESFYKQESEVSLNTLIRTGRKQS